MQLIKWSEAIAASNNAGRDSFRDSTNLSVGAEYKLAMGEKLWLLPRAGFRRLAAPWKDDSKLPAAGFANLLIDTNGSEFMMVTLGVGVRFQTADGKGRGIDIGIDFGADSYNVAFGYVHEF
jgi:hypothetical protein